MYPHEPPSLQTPTPGGPLPRVWSHRGVVLVHGWLLPAPRVGAGAKGTLEHVLRELNEGDQLSTFTCEQQAWWLIRLSTPRYVRVELAWATALTAVGSHLATLPVPPSMVERLQGPSLVWSRQGRLLVQPFESLTPIALDVFIDLGTLVVEPTTSLAAPPEPIAVVERSKPRDEREALGGNLLPPAAELKLFMDGVKQQASEQHAVAARHGQSPPATHVPWSLPNSALHILLGLWLLFLIDRMRHPQLLSGNLWFALTGFLLMRAYLRRYRARRFGYEAASTAAPSKAPAAIGASTPRVPLWRRILKQGWSAALRGSRLSRLVNRRRSQYLENMLQLFEDGRLDEALRHAVPTSNKSWGGDVSQLTAGSFSPRSGLAFSSKGGTASTVLMQDNLLSHLRGVYRQALERLKREGRIEEAAFVLVELLDEPREAIAFLEEHQRYREAARLAELRELDPALIVRLWLLCGDTDRALHVAITHSAFPDAIAQLEHLKLMREAGELRRKWADRLAEGGDYFAAAEVLWMQPDALHVATALAERATCAGGHQGAKALVLLCDAAALPLSKLERLLAQYLAAFAGEGAFGALLLARELSEAQRKTSAGTIHLCHAVLEQLLTKSELTQPTLQLVRKVAEIAGSALRYDLPAAAPATAWVGAPYGLELAAEDRGARPATEAVVLRNHTALVALGESGVLLVDANGRTLHHFDVPSETLVISKHQTRAIGLMRYDDVTRVSRLDLDGRRSQHWLDLRDAIFPESFDGQLLHVVQGERLLALDATSNDTSALWSSHALEGQVIAVHHWDDDVCVVSTLSVSEFRVWRYKQGGYRLLSSLDFRALRVFATRTASCGLFLGGGEEGEANADASSLTADLPMPRLTFGPLPGHHNARVQLPDEIRDALIGRVSPGTNRSDVTFACCVQDAFTIFVTSAGQNLTRVTAWRREDKAPRLTLTLHGVNRASARVLDQILTVSDPLGRVIGVDLDTGRVCYDARLPA